jgi:N-acetylmuramic acid 6-phosphate etherase
MQDEERSVHDALQGVLDGVSQVVDRVVDGFRADGRLFYVGAGTSGRLGVLDASECPPTFGTAAERVQGIIAGGDVALRHAVEGAEDDAAAGALVIREREVGVHDVVCGIAASGRTPFVWGALTEARSRNAATVLITCNQQWAELAQAAGTRVDFPLVLEVGPEIIAGSSRLKAGTATKLVLNMISTAAMIRWGKVYDNLMVDVLPANRKLRDRVGRLVSTIAGTDRVRADELLALAGGSVKVAVLMERGLGRADAEALLSRCGGRLGEALKEHGD